MYRLKETPEQHDPQTRAGKDRWLLSYSDYITLLFALFVLLYALGLQEKNQFDRVLKSLSTMFLTNTKTASTESLPLVLKDLTPAEHQARQSVFSAELINSRVRGSENQPAAEEPVSDDSMKEIQRQINKALRDLVESGLATVKLDQHWLTVELNSGLLFSSGSSVATSSAKAVMQELVPIMNQTPNYIRIRGYTDALPIKTEHFPSNWELSAARSASIVRLLEGAGIEPARMAIEGYGQYSPFADNNTVAGRQQNRKVVIALSRHIYQPDVTPTAGAVQPENAAQQAAEDAVQEKQQKIRVIRLPHGGIRITTRPPEEGEEEPPIEQEE